MHTHIEKRPAIQRRPGDFPLTRLLLKILAHPPLRPDKTLRHAPILLALQIADKLVGEKELDARLDRGVDEPLLRLELGCSTGQTANKGILALECSGERLEGVEVGGFVDDARVCWGLVGGCRPRNGRDGDIWARFEQLGCNCATNVAAGLVDVSC
jgi:hypothetical protein